MDALDRGIEKIFEKIQGLFSSAQSVCGCFFV